jgi:hypothetical protein
MTIASLPLSMGRRPCCHQDGIITLITMALLPLIHDGFVPFFAMVSLPSSSWRHHPCCNGIFVIINAQVSLSS